MYGLGNYVQTSGASPAPGTTLIEHWGGHRGVGQYVPTPNYSLTPAGQAGIRGMGCVCSGLGDCNCGLGQTGIFGTNLFENGFDPTTFGVGEWAAVLIGGYVLTSVFFTTQVATRATRRKGRAVKKALAA